MKMRALNNREKILSGIVGSLLILMVIKVSMFDRYKALQEMDAEIAREQAQLDSNRAIFEKLSSRKLASVPANTTIDLKGYVDGNSRLGNILSSFSDMEQDQKLFKLTKLVSEKREVGKGYEKILFSLEIETSFLSLGTFLEKLENSKYLSRVESVTVNRLGTDLKRCTAIVKFYSYVLRDT